MDLPDLNYTPPAEDEDEMDEDVRDEMDKDVGDAIVQGKWLKWSWVESKRLKWLV